MSVRNSVICIAKDINMDKNYKNTLALSQDEIMTLCQNKSVYMSGDYSFIRTENRIKVQAPFSQIFPGNYCYIINQGVRQFFFVLEVKYIADNTTEIKVEEDVLTTYKDVGFRAAYCERQHSYRDELYQNTVTEPINPGNYMKNGESVYLDCNPIKIVGIFTEEYINDETFITPVPVFNTKYHCGTGLDWKYYPLTEGGLRELDDLYMKYVRAGKASDLLDVQYVYGSHSMTNPKTVTLSIPDKIHSYTPKNKKLFNYPYTFIQFSNNNGSVLQLKPELLGSRLFKMVSIEKTGGSQAFAFPENYMGRMDNFDYGLLIDNYPHLEMTSDSQLEWFGKAKREFKQGLIGKLVSAGLSVALAPVTGGFSLGGVAAAAGSIVTDMTTMATHVDDTPDTVRGQGDGDYISEVCQKFKYTIENMSLTQEQARVVDDFFTRFGYAQSQVMAIMTTNPRFHCHYVKTAPGECVIQGIPQEKADIINAVFNNGITFWDSNDNFGNYQLKNSNDI